MYVFTVYINCTKEFHFDISSHAYNVLWFLPLIFQFLNMFHFPTFMHAFKYFDHIHPTPWPFPLFPPPPAGSHSSKFPILHSFIHFKGLYSAYERTWYLSFWVWFILLKMMISTSIQFPANDVISFFEYMYHIFFIHIAFSCATGAWTQGLHLEPLHQSIFCDRVFWDRVLWTICQSWLITVHNSPNLCLLSSLDYRCEPLVPSILFQLMDTWAESIVWLLWINVAYIPSNMYPGVV
jgi:hypothetical protein